MPVGSIIGGGASLVGGLIGQAASSGDVSQSQADLAQALQNYQNIQVPNITEQEWNLAQEQQSGLLTPQAAATMQMGPNALAGIQTNPAYTQAQQNALQQLGQLGQGGLTNAEKQNLIQASLAASGQAQAANAATSQAMAARGMGGSGVQLAAQLSNSQNAANQQAQQSNAINAMAQQNALGALQQQGGLATQMQGQQFGQQAAVAQAQNAINQFNTANAQNVGMYNTQAANQAQAGNLANQQNIANTNVGLSNQQQAHNTGLYQQQYQDQMAQAQAEAGVLSGQANQQMGLAQQTAGMWSGIGAGIGSAANAATMSNAIGSLGGNNSSGGFNTSPSFNSAATSGNNWGAGSYSMPSMGSSAGLGQPQSGYSLGYAQGGMINPPDYNQGGQVAPPQYWTKGPVVEQQGVGALIGSFFPAKYAHGGEVGNSGSKHHTNLGGSGASLQPTYADGGQVGLSPQQIDQLNAVMQQVPMSAQQQMAMANANSKQQSAMRPGGMLNAGNPAQQAQSQAIIGALLRGNPNAAPAASQGNGMAKGGEVHPRPHKGPAHEPKGHVAQPKVPPSMVPFAGNYNGGGITYANWNKGGEVSTLGMNSYDQGGSVADGTLTADDLKPYMPTPQEEAQSGFPPGPQRAMYIANKKYQAAHPAGDNYDDGGTVGAPLNYPQADRIIPGVGKLSDALNLARGMANQPAIPTKVSGTRYPSAMNPEEAADMAEQAQGQTPVSSDQWTSALAKAQAAQDAYRKAHPPGMYEGGDMKGVPTAPYPKKTDSTDANQVMNKGGKVPAIVSPDERYYTPKQTDKILKGEEKPKETGMVFPGKAPVKGDSPKNDIIKTKLEQGGIVVPRTVSQKSDDDILDFVKKAREGRK